MKKIKSIIPLIFTFCFNSVVYWGAPLLASGMKAHNLSGKTDALVPFIPQFIIIYFGCYIFWVVNYVMIANQGEEHRYRFFTADFYARVVCLICFVFFPTTNTRPELVGHDFWTQAVRFLYILDDPVNLFPSIHCMASAFCCIGIRGRKGIPLWYKGFSIIITILVFISTLALRQHALIDVIGGVLLAEGTWYISQRTDGWRVYQRWTDKVADGIQRSLGRLSAGKEWRKHGE